MDLTACVLALFILLIAAQFDQTPEVSYGHPSPKVLVFKSNCFFQLDPLLFFTQSFHFYCKLGNMFSYPINFEIMMLRFILLGF